MVTTAEEARYHSDSPPGPTFNEASMSSAVPSYDGASFAYFERLPPELRFMIWTHALQARRRLIKVKVIAGCLWNARSVYKKRNQLGNIISGDGYWLIQETQNTRSPIFSVSIEARRVAQDFYHIQFPMLWRRGYINRACLSLNADLDILEVSSVDPESYVDLLSDIRAYDRKKIGLRHLAFTDIRTDLPCLPSNPLDYRLPALSGFKAALMNLETVMFSSRLWPISRIQESIVDGGLGDARLVHSLPIWTNAEEFDLLEADPRQIDEDLSDLVVNGDPKRLQYAWLEMLRCFGIWDKEMTAQYSFLLSASSRESRVGLKKVRSIQTAKDFLNLEKQEWQWRKTPKGGGRRYEINPFVSGDKRRPDPPPATFGFWIFPMEAFGVDFKDKFGRPVTGDSTKIAWKRRDTKDLTAYKPRLGVSILR